MDLKLNFVSFIGIFGLCFFAWISSDSKKNIPWTLIAVGIGLQLILCFIFFIFPSFFSPLHKINVLLDSFYEAGDAGARFLFGGALVPSNSVKMSPLINETTGQFDIQKLINPTTNTIPSNRINFGYIFAIRHFSSIIFLAAFFSFLYRMNILQRVVKFFSKLSSLKIKLSGAEALSGVSNIFFGIESGLIILPYLKRMTRSELATFFTCSLGTISSIVFPMYAGLIKASVPNISNHLIFASLLTIPACFIMAKIIVPETEVPLTLGNFPLDSEEEKKGYLTSLLQGGFTGGRVAIGMIVGIIVCLGIINFINIFFSNLQSFGSNSETSHFKNLISLDNIMGVIFFPFTFFTGISLNPAEIWQASNLIGARLFQTSIPPYIQLGRLHSMGEISDRGLIIISYVLCGFAHLPFIGLFIGGISALIPDRMDEICSLAIRSLWAATLATLMTGALAGLFAFSL